MKNLGSMSETILMTVVFFALLYIAVGAVLVTYKNNLKTGSVEKTDSANVNYDGIEFDSRQAMDIYKADIAINRYYPYYEDFPDGIIFMLSAMAWAGIGVILAQIFYDKEIIVFGKKLVTAFITGLITWLILTFTPDLIVTNLTIKINQKFNYLLATLSGVFTTRFMVWLENLNNDLFPSELKKENKEG